MAVAGFLAGWLVARRRYKARAAKAAAKSAPSALPAGDNRPLT